MLHMRKYRALALVLFLVLVSSIAWHWNELTAGSKDRRKSEDETEVTTISPQPQKPAMAVAVVVCGNRSAETLVMIKSALLLTKRPLHFYIFADEEASKKMRQSLDDWQPVVNRSYSYELRDVEFPPGEFHAEWKKLFKPCAAQRLFLPSMLNDADSILYMDTDTMFLGPVEQVWDHFDKMNESQFAALAPEHEDPNVSWYIRFAKHPFYKPLGVNSGVMLMNLTRMRAFGWESYVEPIYKKFKTKIPWGDQDIINIIFSYHPEKLYIYGCQYNYREEHCMYMSACKGAESEGVIVLHGSRGTFHREKQPTFHSVYKAMENYKWTSDPYDGFLVPLRSYLDNDPESKCGNVKEIFSKNVAKFIDKPKSHQISP